MAKAHERASLFVALAALLLLTGGFIYYKYNTTIIANKGTAVSVPSPDLSGMEPQVGQKIRKLSAEVKQNPGSADSWGRLGMTLDVHGLKEEAIPCYKKAAQLAPRDFRWSYYCAINLKESGSAEALLWFRAAAAKNALYLPLQLRYARALLDAGRFIEAGEHFQQALKLDGKSAEAYLGLAQIAVSQSDPQKGKDLAEKAIGIRPDLSEAYHILALACRRLGDGDAAEGAIEKTRDLPEKSALIDPVYAALAAEGESAYWYRTRGRAYLESGLYSLAYKHFQTALKLHEDADAYDNLGVALQGLGRWEEAIQYHKKAIAMSPTYLKFNNLGLAYARTGQMEPAMDSFRESIKLKSDNAEAYFNLGVVYFKMSRYEEAVKYLTQAVLYKPTHAQAHFALAMCYRALGQRENALHEDAVLQRLQTNTTPRREGH